MQKLCDKSKTFISIGFEDSIGTQYTTRLANVKSPFRALNIVKQLLELDHLAVTIL